MTMHAQGAPQDEAEASAEAVGEPGQEAVMEVPVLPEGEVAASIGDAVSGDPVCEAVMAAQELSELVMPGSGEQLPFLPCWAGYAHPCGTLPLNQDACLSSICSLLGWVLQAVPSAP